MFRTIFDANPGEGLGQPTPDSSEQVNISLVSLLKMLNHGRLPNFLGEPGFLWRSWACCSESFPNEYTTHVVEVVAMLQHGTGVSLEAIDRVFQTDMLDMLKQTQRLEMVVGWYHSHPGFGCWLSGVDMTTQQGFEALNRHAVAVVVDPIQSGKGIDPWVKPELLLPSSKFQDEWT
ncbi:hypothetical protein Pyn_05032 [Prunus yedoensis var. nudiflora]|uniref:MPN domain-containing protein n=1 Tax=Prunus yedoensis var. nudiflora TaxID=2094558 RepID=A0A314Z100_PRUYE|nr:hypothetical protein Pyn_05032 [Prunus yedoensis var. nudiflora]